MRTSPRAVQAKQYRAHSAALVRRAHLLADHARELQTDAAELLQVSNGSRRHIYAVVPARKRSPDGPAVRRRVQG